MSNAVLQVGVKILLKNNEGKYLLLRRNPEKYPEAQCGWDIVGGRIDAGSALRENLRREIKEETGLEYMGEPKLIAAQDILRVEGKHVVRLTYIGELDGEPQIDEESMEYKWFDSEKIQKMNEGQLDIYFKELLDSKVLKL